VRVRAQARAAPHYRRKVARRAATT
jgi:hypothetical protein